MKTTRVCVVESCFREASLRGMCRPHYQRARRLGEFEPSQTPSAADRLKSGLVEKANGCIEWTGNVDRKGYGRIGVNNKHVGTHQLAWELVNGPIPEGMCVLHHCDNPPCCNVSKCLFLGTIADNNRDMSAKGRNHNTLKTHCPQGHEYTPQNTYVRPSKGTRKCRTCGIAYTARWLKESRAS